MKDEHIIISLREGKIQKAVKGLYSAFPLINQHVSKNSGSKEDAEDLFQDALVILYKKVKDPEFKLSSSLSTFLFGIAKNLWYQELKRRNKVLEPEIFEEDFSESDLYKQAEEAFKLLGDKCREILILFYYAGKSMSEIAKIMSFSNERVAKTQKYRCIEKAKLNFNQLNQPSL